MTTIRVQIGGGWKNMVVSRPSTYDTKNATSAHSYIARQIPCKNREQIGESKCRENATYQLSAEKNVCDKQDSILLPQTGQLDTCEKSTPCRIKLSSPTLVTEEGSCDGFEHLGNQSVPGENHEGADRLDKKKEHHKKTNILLLPEMPRVTESFSIISGVSDTPTRGLGARSRKIEPEVTYDAYPILRHVQDSVIGHDHVIRTPYGPRKVTYCDFTASGRCLSFIEDFIRQNVMPTYANTHSVTGHNARQTGIYREEARNIIKQCVNASAEDVVVFTGSGATAGVHKIAWALRLNSPVIAMETVVFIGPYEHHSNILLWRELGTEIVRIRQDQHSGTLDFKHFTEELKTWREKSRQLLVCMSAASNVTGIITDVDAVARLAHQYGAFAVFDYAGGGPYLRIDMNPSKTEYKDAVIISPHKFVGGPGTPGVLVAKKWLFRNSVPGMVGGGTVAFVTHEQHWYTRNIEEREEGGTPAIIESVRAGLVFQLKEKIGTELIHAREKILVRRAFHVWEQNPCILLLGSHTADRIPIFSFLTIHQETGRLIHHNFIATLLSDLYGIQARGGCACAGPYAMELMGISKATAEVFTDFLVEQSECKNRREPRPVLEVMRPGFTRINLAYFMDEESVDFIIQAVDMVTKYGWKLLPRYSFDIKSGSWLNKNFAKTSASELMRLQHALAVNQGSTVQGHTTRSQKSPSYKGILGHAEELYKEADKIYTRSRISSSSLSLHENLPQHKRALKWFLSPYEAANILADKAKKQKVGKQHTQELYRLPFQLQKPAFLSDHQRVDSSNQSKINSTMIPPNAARGSVSVNNASTMIPSNITRGSDSTNNASTMLPPNSKRGSVSTNNASTILPPNSKRGSVSTNNASTILPPNSKRGSVSTNNASTMLPPNSKRGSVSTNNASTILPPNSKRGSVSTNNASTMLTPNSKRGSVSTKHLSSTTGNNNSSMHSSRDRANQDTVYILPVISERTYDSDHLVSKSLPTKPQSEASTLEKSYKTDLANCDCSIL